ncbi:hypothetical protein DM82_2363 [Burkholderia oklahomensis]|uniref:Uncharacterized protein n=1 Tax=Burkholderia oklahomensis TaxID=342113 RepID=A0AAI8FME1_9BURK|nr:hypothetical protein DM82_2363 [Burkholderia oklahomensis]
MPVGHRSSCVYWKRKVCLPRSGVAHVRRQDSETHEHRANIAGHPIWTGPTICESTSAHARSTDPPTLMRYASFLAAAARVFDCVGASHADPSQIVSAELAPD